jgi:hypothetical protein
MVVDAFLAAGRRLEDSGDRMAESRARNLTADERALVGQLRSESRSRKRVGEPTLFRDDVR